MPAPAPRAPASFELEVGREAALVADRGAEPAVVQRPLQRVEDLGAHPQRLGEASAPTGHDHELLEVDLVVGVRAAVQDVHHRHRQHVRRLAAQVAPERQPASVGGRLARPRATRRGSRWRRGAPCWACRRARSSRGRGRLVGGVAARRPPSAISPLTFSTARVTPLPPQLAAVAQLDRLELAGRGARRHGGAADAPDASRLDLDRRVAPASRGSAGRGRARSRSTRYFRLSSRNLVGGRGAQRELGIDPARSRRERRRRRRAGRRAASRAPSRAGLRRVGSRGASGARQSRLVAPSASWRSRSRRRGPRAAACARRAAPGRFSGTSPKSPARGPPRRA